MSRLLQIARKDFRDAARDGQLYVLGALFLLIGLGIGYLAGSNAGSTAPQDVPQLTLLALVFFGSIAAITLSYNQIVGKRASGELRVLLSLPFSRTEVVYGTFLGRLALVVTLTWLSLLLATGVAVVMGAPVAFDLLLGAILVIATLIAVFVSLAVGLSAGSVNTTRAAAGAFGLFIVFLFRLWDGVPIAARYVLNGFSFPSGPAPTWARVWAHLQPMASLRNAIAEMSPPLTEAFGAYAAQIPASQPYYTEPWFGALVTAAWIVLPVTLGYVRLRSADL
jgi:ABC-2 type transport system permease protein